MPTKPKTFRLHQPAQGVHRPCDQWRGSSRERGYDSDWTRLRNSVIAEEPLCWHCMERGEVTIATEVDHIRPFNGKDDPLRLDRQNLQPLCHSCHVRKTKRDKGLRCD